MLLTEVLRTDPDSEVLLSFLRQTHPLHYLLYSSIVSMFQLNRAIWPIHTINSCLFILHKNLNILNKELVKIVSLGASEEESNFTIIQQHPYCWEKEHCTTPAYLPFIYYSIINILFRSYASCYTVLRTTVTPRKILLIFWGLHFCWTQR